MRMLIYLEFWDLERPPSEEGGEEKLEQHRSSMERERGGTTSLGRGDREGQLSTNS